MAQIKDQADIKRSLDTITGDLPVNAWLVWQAVREKVDAQPHPATLRHNGMEGHAWHGVLNQVVTELWPGLRDGTLDPATSITARRRLNTYLRSSNNLVCVDRGNLPKGTQLPKWWVSQLWNDVVVTLPENQPASPPTPLDMSGFGTRPTPAPEVEATPAPSEALPVVEESTLDDDDVNLDISTTVITPAPTEAVDPYSTAQPHTDTRDFPCRKGCGTVIVGLGNLKVHEKICDGSEAQYVCGAPGCGRRYGTPQGLGSHSRQKHPELTVTRLAPVTPTGVVDGEDGRFYCGKNCGTWFEFGYKRNRHEKGCSGVPAVHLCHHQGCEHRFNTRTALAAHQRIHGGALEVVTRQPLGDEVLRFTPLSDEEVRERVLALVTLATRLGSPLILTALRQIPSGASKEQRDRVLDQLIIDGVVQQAQMADVMNRLMPVYVADVTDAAPVVNTTTEAALTPARRRAQYAEQLQELLRDYEELQGRDVALDRALTENQKLQGQLDKIRQAFGA